MLARRAAEVLPTTMLTWSRRMVTGTTSDEQTALNDGDMMTQDAGVTSMKAAVAARALRRVRGGLGGGGTSHPDR